MLLLFLISGVFVNCFFIAYMISPRFCHRFVGYLEEEAVKTYTYCLKVILLNSYSLENATLHSFFFMKFTFQLIN